MALHPKQSGHKGSHATKQTNKENDPSNSQYRAKAIGNDVQVGSPGKAFGKDKWSNEDGRPTE